MATIGEVLSRSRRSVTDIARRSGVNLSTLTQAYKKPVTSWSVRVLDATAKGLQINPSDLLDELQEDKYRLEIDNKTQTIQGVHFTDHAEYQAIRFVVENESYEGWEPSHEDILWLHHDYHKQHPEYEQLYKECFGPDNE